MEERIKAAREALEAALRTLNDAGNAVEALTDDASEEERSAAVSCFNEAEAEVKRIDENLRTLERVAEARAAHPLPQPEERSEGSASGERIVVGREEPVYRPDAQVSFYRDLVMGRDNPVAAERLARHQAQVGAAEHRDVAISAVAGFMPPNYLAAQYAQLPRPGRPFADALPKAPLPATGNTLSIPRITTGTSTAIQAAEADAVSETDIDDTTLTVSVRTIAGQNDVSRQALDRSEPGIDQIIFNDLMSAYDSALDAQLLSGTGSNGQHLGIRAVTGRNTVSYTAATPTQSGLLPKIYNLLSEIHSGRYLAPSHIVLHPRRAAWLASALVSTAPIFQQGQLNQAVGTQDLGLVTAFGGLVPIVDANIGTTYGAGTDEDEIYIVRAADLVLMEGEVQTGVFRDVLSGTGQVRLQVWAYSAFTSGKQPEAIGHLSGTGLAAPTFS